MDEEKRVAFRGYIFVIYNIYIYTFGLIFLTNYQYASIYLFLSLSLSFSN
jgi:hypothetical protein